MLAALAKNAAVIIFEIARCEMGYCEQPSAGDTANVLAAAIKEGYCHPRFIQGNHFQFKVSKFQSDPKIGRYLRCTSSRSPTSVFVLATAPTGNSTTK